MHKGYGLNISQYIFKWIYKLFSCNESCKIF